MKTLRSGKNRYSKLNILLTVFGSFMLLTITTSGFLSSQSSENQQRRNKDDYNQRKENLRTRAIATENKTRFEIINLERLIDKGFIVMHLKNEYQKPITGYKFSFGVSLEYVERQNKGILPGEVIKEIQPLQLGLDREGIKMLAVIFDDGSTDGDPHYINEIKQRREGAKYQATQTLYLLQAAANSQDTYLDNLLSKVESALAPLSRDEMDKLSPDKIAGINSIRYLTLQELRIIRSLHITKTDIQPLTKREGFNQLIERLKQLQ